jgi:hypothetical protein
MISRTALHLAFALVVLVPVAAGCEKKADGAPDAAAATPALNPNATAPVIDPAAPPPPTGTPVAPLSPAVPGAPGVAVKPAVTDGGKVVATDAGAAADGGNVAPAPTPVFTIPTAIPGFDAGAFKPPPGLPSTIPTTFPTVPPPAK